MACKNYGGTFTIDMSDDGAGIDLDQIESKVITKGFVEIFR